MKAKDIKERFFSKVNKGGPNGCWLWVGCLNENGYGKLGARLFGIQKNWKAHRISWYVEYGVMPPPERKVLHRCNVPACVNPAHLYEGTQDDNMKYMNACGRHAKEQPKMRGEKHPLSRLTAEDVLEIRRLYGIESSVSLARRFKVTQANISQIQLRKSWKYLL